MNLQQIGNRLVALVNAGNWEQAVEELYGANIISIEAMGSPEMPARMEGIQAVKGKGEWWKNNHVIHGMSAKGPFIGSRKTQFAVEFSMDVTNKTSQQRMQMTEVAMFTTKGNKIIKEEFMMGGQ